MRGFGLTTHERRKLSISEKYSVSFGVHGRTLCDHELIEARSSGRNSLAASQTDFDLDESLSKQRRA